MPPGLGRVGARSIRATAKRSGCAFRLVAWARGRTPVHGQPDQYGWRATLFRSTSATASAGDIPRFCRPRVMARQAHAGIGIFVRDKGYTLSPRGVAAGVAALSSTNERRPSTRCAVENLPQASGYDVTSSLLGIQCPRSTASISRVSVVFARIRGRGRHDSKTAGRALSTETSHVSRRLSHRHRPPPRQVTGRLDWDYGRRVQSPVGRG